MKKKSSKCRKLDISKEHVIPLTKGLQGHQSHILYRPQCAKTVFISSTFLSLELCCGKHIFRKVLQSSFLTALTKEINLLGQRIQWQVFKLRLQWNFHKIYIII